MNEAVTGTGDRIAFAEPLRKGCQAPREGCSPHFLHEPATEDTGRRQPPNLREGDEFRIVHVDHHGLMIDPKPSLQAHTPLETRAVVQTHTMLEKTGV